MSDTPRTDAQRHDPTEHDGLVPHIRGDWVPAQLSEQLERELAAVTKERDELRSQLIEAVELMYGSECPSSNCQDGILWVPEDDGRFSQERCQFCAKRDALLARIEGGAK